MLLHLWPSTPQLFSYQVSPNHSTFLTELVTGTLWLKPHDLSGQRIFLASWPGNFSFDLYQDSLRFVVQTSAQVEVLTCPLPPVQNWSFLHFTFAPESLTVQINRDLIKSITFTPRSFQNLQLTIGTRANALAGHHFDGELKQLYCWDRYLTDQELARLYNEGRGLELL